MGIVFTSITVNTPNLENMLRFYEILGCQFSKIKVNLGSELFRSTLEGFELSLLSNQAGEVSLYPKVMMGFKINELEKKINQLYSIPGVVVILDPTDLSDGRKAILQDPDGNSVELLAV